MADDDVQQLETTPAQKLNIPAPDAPGPDFARGGVAAYDTSPFVKGRSGAGPYMQDIVGDYEGARAGAEALTREKLGTEIATNKHFLARMEHDAASQRTAFGALAHGPDSLPQPWDADKEQAERTRTPLEAFGSVGSVFAMIAAGFSRQPMMAALNAGAAAMNAVHQSDQAAYEKAYTAWKDNTNLAIKRFDMQQKVFDDTQHLFDTDQKIWQAESLANAAKFNDKIALNLLSHGQYPEYFDVMNKRANAINRMRETVEGQEIYNAKQAQMESYWEDIREQHGDFSGKKWNITQINKAMALKMVELNAKDEPTRLMAAGLREYFMENGRDMPAAEQFALRQKLTTRAITPAQQISDMAAYNMSPEGGSMPPDQAMAKAVRDYEEAKSKGKVAGQLDLARFKAEHQKEIAKMNNEAKSELALKLDENKGNRLEISENFKRELAKMAIDARNEVIDKLEEGRNNRLDRTEIGKGERQDKTITAQGERQDKSIAARKEIAAAHDAAVDARSQRILEGKQQDNAPMSDAAINSLVARTLAGEPTASVRRNIGYNRASNSNLNKYNDALALAMDAGGITPDDLNKRQADWQGKIAAGRTAGGAETGSLKVTLNQIVPMSHALDQYERSMLRQLDVLVDLGKKVDRTGVPVIEKWYRAGRKATGDPDVADFDLQWNLVATEAARAIANPRLVGVLTDTAKREMQEALPRSANVRQLERISARLHADADIRREEIGKEIESVKGQLQEGHVKPFVPSVKQYEETRTLPDGTRVGRRGKDWFEISK